MIATALVDKQALMSPSQSKAEEPVQSEVHCDRKQANEHGEVPLVDGVEHQRQNFHAGITGETNGIKPQS